MCHIIINTNELDFVNLLLICLIIYLYEELSFINRCLILLSDSKRTALTQLDNRIPNTH